MLTSVKQLDRFCAEFVTFYNRDRPHSAWQGRTPDEIYFAKKRQRRPLGRVHEAECAASWAWLLGEA
ncbi:MAG: transposase [Deltaproteobacteria bacterium]|nr:transposase [Deltaproteobacteria bacterium]